MYKDESGDIDAKVKVDNPCTCNAIEISAGGQKGKAKASKRPIWNTI